MSQESVEVGVGTLRRSAPHTVREIGRRALFAAVIIAAMSAPSSQTTAQGAHLATDTQKSAPIDWRFVHEHLNSRHCGEGALLLWNRVRQGDPKAFMQLVGALYGPKLKLPNVPFDGLYISRLLATLTVHGLSGYEGQAEVLFDDFAVSFLDRFARICAKKPGRDFKACVRYLHRHKVVPSKEEIIAELTSYIGSAGAADFVCLAYRK